MTGKEPRFQDDAPLLPDRASEDRDEGWGEGGSSSQFSDEWYAEQRPPHW